MLGYMKPGLEAAVHPTIQDIAWAAGIYEGEGSCQKKPYSTAVRIRQKDSWLPLRLKVLFGGSICYRKDGQLDWFASGSRARGFLMTIYKFLSPRRQKQIRHALGVH